MRASTAVLLLTGAGYLLGCTFLTWHGTPAFPWLAWAGLACVMGAYGVAAVCLLGGRRRRLGVLELTLLLVFGLLFRLVLLLRVTVRLAAVSHGPLAWAGPPVGDGALHPPGPPVVQLLSVLFLLLEPEVPVGRLVLFALEIGVWGILLALLEEERRPSKWLLLYVWHPVAVLYSATWGLTSAAVLFLVLGLWFYRRNLEERGTIALGLSAAGSYLVWPGLAAVLAGRARSWVVVLAGLAALVASGAVVGLVNPAWTLAVWQTVWSELHNAGPFALVTWLTGSRWVGWAVLGVSCSIVAWLSHGRRPAVLVGRMLKTAVVTSPVVWAGGLHVILPLLVLQPSVTWVVFPCVVLTVQAAFPGGAVPAVWLALEYGVLAAGMLLEWWFGRAKRRLSTRAYGADWSLSRSSRAR